MQEKSVKLNALLNVSKQVCTIIFPFITFPYTTRVIGAVNYGKVNFVSSIISYFLLIAAFGVFNYAVREGARYRNDKERFEEFACQVYTINVITTCIAYALLIALFLLWSHLRDYTTLLLVYSLSIGATTLGRDWINTIYEDYLYITVRYLIFQILSIVLLLLFVRSEGDFVAYVGILVFASCGANVLNVFYIRRYAHVHVVFRNIEFKRHIVPMALLFGATVASTIYLNSDITMIGIMLTDGDLGMYSFSTRLYSIAKQVLNAVIVVIVPRAAHLLGQKDMDGYNKLLKTSLNSLLGFALPSATGLFIIAPEVTALVGGSQYLGAADSLRILSVTLPFATLAYFYTSTLLVPNRHERESFVIMVISAILNLGLNFFFIPWFGINGAAFTTLLAEFAVFILAWAQSRDMHKPFIDTKMILQLLIPTASVFLCCNGMHVVAHGTLYVLLAIAASVASYSMLGLLVGNEFVMNVFSKLLPYIKR